MISTDQVMETYCVFCRSNAKLTNEHIVARRWRQFFPGGPLHFTLHIGTYGGAKTVRWRNDALDLKAKCACRTCNSGWMEKLDVSVEPALIPMIQGQGVRLDKRWKTALAVWAVKTTVVGLKAHTPPLPISDLWCHMFYATKMPPTGTFIWLAACDQAPAVTMRSNVIQFESGKIVPTSPDGYIFTLSIGHLVLQVAIFGFNNPGFPAYLPPAVRNKRSDLLELWPQIFTDYLWPPGVGPALSGADIDALANRFYDSPIKLT